MDRVLRRSNIADECGYRTKYLDIVVQIITMNFDIEHIEQKQSKKFLRYCLEKLLAQIITKILDVVQVY